MDLTSSSERMALGAVSAAVASSQPTRNADNLVAELRWSNAPGMEFPIHIHIGAPECIASNRFVSLVRLTPLLGELPVQGADPRQAFELAVRLCEDVLRVHARLGHALQFLDGRPYRGCLASADGSRWRRV